MDIYTEAKTVTENSQQLHKMKAKLIYAWNVLNKIAPIVVVILLFIMLKNCNAADDERIRQRNNVNALQSDITDLKLSNGELAQEKALFEVTKEEMKKEIWMEVDDTIKALLKRIKDPVIIIKVRTEYKIPPGYVPFNEPVPYAFNRNFKKTEEWYSISGTADQNGINFDSILIPNTQRLIVGYKKKQLVARITNSNPHITSTGIEGQVIEISKKRWVIGIGGTVDILARPSFGLFVGRKLFEF